MDNTLIENLAKCFSHKNNPVVIFCDWKDAEKIMLDFKEKINGGSQYGHFDNKDRIHNINYFSCCYFGTEFIFCDQNQTKEFLEIYNKKQNGKN